MLLVLVIVFAEIDEIFGNVCLKSNTGDRNTFSNPQNKQKNNW